MNPSLTTATAGSNIAEKLKNKFDFNSSEIQNLKYIISTFGCQMNYSDSERLASLLESYGYSAADSIEEATLVIFNTCSIKQKAEDRVLGQMKTIAKMKKKNPDVLFGITGCMTRLTSSRISQKKDKLLTQLKELDFVFQIQDLPKVGELLKQVKPDLAILEASEADLDSYFKIQPKYATPFQAYIPIMTGCDKFCTYCIVPYSRGREKSRKIDDIYLEAVQLVESGCKEITLLGQNVNSYGLSWNDKKSEIFSYEENPFVQLLKKLDTIPGLLRLRFTSPHPQDMTPDVIDTIADSRTLMPYIHLPLQSGSDYILKRMNRNYDTAKFRSIVEYIRKRMPDCTISTDMIVGFCGETAEHYEETYNFFKEIGFDLAFISQFSARKGTAADKLMTDDVSREDKAQRWHRLNDLLRVTSLKRNQYFEGKTVKVLVEKQNNDSGLLHGRSEHYKEVLFKGDTSLIGEVVEVKIDKALEWLLEGTLV
jgi:tRNA-2-methylthio-N6-dimethylallyladenosine synthase